MRNHKAIRDEASYVDFSFRVLVKLLQDSTEPLVLAVAAHDIGQYVKHYERGKKYVARL